jgi:peptidyl-prolyl cis-trans isomerase A (cyclophilin A)
MMTCLAVGLGVAGAWAQAKQGTAQRPTLVPEGVNGELLKPAMLREQAPATYDVKFTTTKGDFTVRVTRAWAPIGADRFYNLVKKGYYDGCSLFRVVPGFVVQFGISAYPIINRAWMNANIKDDPVKASNKRGFITFATGGPNTRTTQVFINLSNGNTRLDGMGFAPFGEVVEGMDVVEKFYSGYGEATTNRQGEIYAQGNAFLTKNFPKLDSIKTAKLVEAAATPAKP